MSNPATTPYWEKLKDPRWQKKRLEVLNAANWKCAMCADGTNALNVHHPEYLPNREPWEYDNLVCLCESCHEAFHRKLSTTSTQPGTTIFQALGMVSDLLDKVDRLPPHTAKTVKRDIYNKLVLLADESGVPISDEIRAMFTSNFTA